MTVDFFDLELVGTIDVVTYPERFADVLAGTAMWTVQPMSPATEIIELHGPRDAGGVRYVRDYELPADLGEGAWRRHDPAHPRCWWCGRFTSPKLRGRYEPPCLDCGEPIDRW